MLVDAQLQPSRMAGRLVFLLYALSSALLFSQWCASWWLALLLAFGLSCLLWRVTAWFARGAAQKQPAVSFLEQEPRQAWRWQKQGHSRWYQGRLCRAQGFGAWAILAAMIVAVPVYAVALAGFGGLTKEDLEDIPFIGRRVLAVGRRFGYFK